LAISTEINDWQLDVEVFSFSNSVCYEEEVNGGTL